MIERMAVLSPERLAVLSPGRVAYAPRVVASPRLMAGFGAADSAPKKKPSQGVKPTGKAASKAANKVARSSGLSAKKQWDRHSELIVTGAATTSVWARPANAEDGEDGEDWMEVGTISAEEPSSLEAAAHAQKRLILEHAGRLSPRLLVLKALEAGYGEAATSVTPVPKGVPPEGVTCGLVGLPDPGGFYSRSLVVNLRTGATGTGGAAPASDSKGRVA